MGTMEPLLSSLPLGLAAALLLLTAWVAVAQTKPSWTREAFLGARARDPEVTRLVESARTNSDFSLELRNAKDDAARAALLRIAYGELGQAGRVNAAAFAADCYVRSLESKSQARALLLATNDDVVASGLRALIGQPLDPELFERFKLILQSDSARLRSLATRVLREDRDASRIVERGRLILDSMRTTPRCKDADGTVLVGEPFFFHPWSCAEIALSDQARALGSMKGLPPAELTVAPLPPPGLARDYVAIARAEAGDTTIRPELRNVLLNSSSVWARIMAMDLVARDPTSEDLAVLKTVAESDPFQAKPTVFYFRMPRADLSLEGKKGATIYPIRLLASQKLQELSGTSD